MRGCTRVRAQQQLVRLRLTTCACVQLLKFNGEEVKNLQDLAQRVLTTKAEFLEFEYQDGVSVVLDAADARASTADVRTWTVRTFLFILSSWCMGGVLFAPVQPAVRCLPLVRRLAGMLVHMRSAACCAAGTTIHSEL